MVSISLCFWAISSSLSTFRPCASARSFRSRYFCSMAFILPDCSPVHVGPDNFFLEFSIFLLLVRTLESLNKAPFYGLNCPLFQKFHNTSKWYRDHYQIIGVILEISFPCHCSQAFGTIITRAIARKVLFRLDPRTIGFENRSVFPLLH